MFASIVPYIKIARVDHWVKNVFMLLGALLAFFFEPPGNFLHPIPRLLFGLLCVCLIASSNYVINEILDAPTDAHHPTKKNRPIPSGQVRVGLAYAEWLFLGGLGLTLSLSLNPGFFYSGVALWVMGLLYNLPPIRTKELPYLDVLTESINNPLRLLLGWFVIIPNEIPPVSLLIVFWMFGAFFMAIKRYAELRQIGDREQAAQYRRSFSYYTEERLLVSFFFYAVVGSLFAGVFIVRYHFELILFLPVAAAYLAYYLKIGLKPDSAVQAPEKLHKEKGFLLFSGVSLVLFLALMFARIPVLYDVFQIRGVGVKPLWTFEAGHAYED